MADPEQPEVRAELEREAAKKGDKPAKEKTGAEDSDEHDDKDHEID